MEYFVTKSRSFLSQQDLAFVSHVLGRNPREREHLLELLCGDAHSRDSILDDPALYTAVLESPQQLSISLHLYFYILLRKRLCEADLDHRPLTDYIAGLLSDWTQSPRFDACLQSEGRAHYSYASDLWKMMATSDENARYEIFVFMGNHYLFMTGVFPRHIRHQSKRHGGPRLKFYEETGRRGYLMAARHRLAARDHHHELFSLLAECFTVVRHSLNDLSERQTFIAGV